MRTIAIYAKIIQFSKTENYAGIYAIVQSRKARGCDIYFFNTNNLRS